MSEGESQRHDCEGKPRKFTEGDVGEFFVDKISEEKSSPKNLLHKRHHHDEAQEAESDRRPVGRRARRKNLRVKPIRPRRETEILLRRDPEKEDEDPDRNRKENASQPMQFIF